MKSTITFSDKSAIELHEDDFITPVATVINEDECFASLSKPVDLYNHVHDGLLPSILSALCSCDFFFINDNRETAYAKNAIVKIESN